MLPSFASRTLSAHVQGLHLLAASATTTSDHSRQGDQNHRPCCDPTQKPRPSTAANNWTRPPLRATASEGIG